MRKVRTMAKEKKMVVTVKDFLATKNGKLHDQVRISMKKKAKEAKDDAPKPDADRPKGDKPDK